MLNPDRHDSNNHSANLLADLAADGKWSDSAWAKALTADGFRSCLFIPILNSKRQPLAVFSLFSSDAAKLTSDSQLAQTATHLITIAFGKREREEELGTERERPSLALAAGKLGIGNWDLVTNELAWSEQCKILFGYLTDAKVTFEDFLAVLHPKDRDRTMKAIEGSIRDDIPYDIEYRVLHPDGTVRWIAATGRTFRDDFDRPMGMGGVARDVTERRQFDEDSQENQHQLRTALNAAELARREAETATRAKDQFLAVLSHELRTPLTPIMMAASLLRNAQELSEQARNAFDMIFRIQQVFWNLLKNAIKFTPEGGVIFVTSRNENDDIVVEVSDSGIGIDPGIIPKIFVPFEQGIKT